MRPQPPRPPPPPSALAEAREWISRATEDLEAAELTLRSTPPHLGTSAFHAQQAGEKALKGFLAAHQVDFRPTHNLQQLYLPCADLEPGFRSFAAVAQTLTPYATRFRYPGGPLHPSQAEAEQARRDAAALLEFVRHRLGI